MLIEEIYNKYRSQFIEHDLEEIVLRIILCNYYGYKDMTDLQLSFKDDKKVSQKLENIMKRVLNGTPVEYALNSCVFYNFDFYVNRNVLIPRVETEELVFYSLKRINEKFYSANALTIADICTGSGNIAISIDKCLQLKHKVYGVDISYKALMISNYNKKKLGSAVLFRHSDSFSYFVKNKIKLDVLVCNPPYISKINEIDKSVKGIEPDLALLAYPSYRFYEDIINNISKLMNDKFIVAFEIGYDQKAYLAKIIEKSSIINKIKYEFIKDINGKDRILIIESKI